MRPPLRITDLVLIPLPDDGPPCLAGLAAPDRHDRVWLFEADRLVARLDDEPWTVTVDRVECDSTGAPRRRWRRSLRAALLEARFETLTDGQIAGRWACDALGADEVSPDVVRAVVARRFGERVAIFNMNDRAANLSAKADGFCVIPSRTFDRAAWANVRAATGIRTAGAR
jgi:hypothetical protein